MKSITINQILDIYSYLLEYFYTGINLPLPDESLEALMMTTHSSKTSKSGHNCALLIVDFADSISVCKL